MSTSAYSYTPTHAYTFLNFLTHTHTHIHTYIHTYIHTPTNHSAEESASWEKLVSLALPPNQRRGPRVAVELELDEHGNPVPNKGAGDDAEDHQHQHQEYERPVIAKVEKRATRPKRGGTKRDSSGVDGRTSRGKKAKEEAARKAAGT